MIRKDTKKRIYTSIALIFLLILIIKFKFLLVFSLIVLGVIAFLEFSNITKRIFKKKIIFLVSNIFFLIYISIFCSIFFILSNFIQLKILLFSLLLTCVASDIGGFVFGRFFGGPKISRISPKKTFSGSAGSLIFATITFTLIIFYFTQTFVYETLLIGLITSLFCQIGDLFFSYLKRLGNLKDTGNLLPGHGGLLDRIDGILFGIPLGYLTIIFFY